MWFGAISGLKINLNKSKIIPVGRVANVAELAAELGCGVGSLPTKYLGLPLGAPSKSLGVKDSIEERFRKRLFSCKRQYISKGGRLTLIWSMIDSRRFKGISHWVGLVLKRSRIWLNGGLCARKRTKGV